MNAAFIALIILLFGLIMLGLEFLWLYVLAVRQENRANKYSAAKEKAEKIISSIFYSPTALSRRNEIKALQNLIDGDYLILEMVYEQIEAWKNYGDGEFIEIRKAILAEIDEALKPVDFYGKMLKEGKNYFKAYACRKLADFGANGYLDDIKALIKSSNSNLSYNAAMALSKLGECESVKEYIINKYNDAKYSDRIFFEIIRIYGGDRAVLAEKLYSQQNDLLKTKAVQAFAPYALSEFSEMYRKEAKSTDVNMKIAAVKALAALNNPEFEHDLILAVKDRNWIVRISALKGLEKFDSHSAVQGVIEATKDKEWWVRNTAAQCLLNMNVSVVEIENILKGYDRYAADAVKYSLYRKIDLRGDDKA